MNVYHGYIQYENRPRLREEDLIFLRATSDELALRQAAHDSIEITELKQQLERAYETEDETWERHLQEAQEALYKCGLCTCMEPLVDGRCEMCDPPHDGETGDIEDGLDDWGGPEDDYYDLHPRAR